MGAKKDTYKAIATHLMNAIGVTNIGDTETTLSPDGGLVPKLRWVDLNRGQVQFLTKEMGIPIPAVLISFPEIEYEALSAGVKKGMATIRITTLFESFADAYQGSINQDIALEYFEFNDLLFETLEGLSGDSFSKLIRVREADDENHDFLIITETDYMTELYEVAKVKAVEFISGNPIPVKVPLAPDPTPTSNSGQFVVLE